jgi:hypothetical protein
MSRMYVSMRPAPTVYRPTRCSQRGGHRTRQCPIRDVCIACVPILLPRAAPAHHPLFLRAEREGALRTDREPISLAASHQHQINALDSTKHEVQIQKARGIWGLPLNPCMALEPRAICAPPFQSAQLQIILHLSVDLLGRGGGNGSFALGWVLRRSWSIC